MPRYELMTITSTTSVKGTVLTADIKTKRTAAKQTHKNTTQNLHTHTHTHTHSDTTQTAPTHTHTHTHTHPHTHTHTHTLTADNGSNEIHLHKSVLLKMNLRCLEVLFRHFKLLIGGPGPQSPRSLFILNGMFEHANMKTHRQSLDL